MSASEALRRERHRFRKLAWAVCVALGAIQGVGVVSSFAQPTPEIPVVQTPEQKASLATLDAAIGWFEADLARVTDVGHKARIQALLDAFKERRDAVRKRFDQVRYEELRYDLNVEYQRLGQLLSAPNTPAPRGQPPRPAKLEVSDLNLVMVPIAAGTFVLGRPAGAPDSSPDESPETRVTFSKPFWLGATEVTVSQWRRFVEATRYRTDAETGDGIFVSNGSGQAGMAGWEKKAGLSWRNPGREQTDDHPVVGVSWNDAQRFCAWLTERERATGRSPAGYAYTLPTEAQWEYACRAGNFGPDPERLDDWAWFAANSGRIPHSVGTKRPNVWGLYDMQGNVWEWCLDWSGPYPGGSVTDPQGPPDGPWHQNRGGSARSPGGRGISSTNRWNTPGLHQRDDLGFRVALSAVR